MPDRKLFMPLAFIGFVVVFGVLTVWFWDFVADTILVPVYYVLWVGTLLVNSVQQELYLALLVLVGIIIGTKTLEGLRASPQRTRVKPDLSNDTRYLRWRVLTAHNNWFSKGQLAREVHKLVLSILALEYGVEPQEAEVMVRAGTIEIPDILRFVVETKTIPDAPSGPYANIRSRLRRAAGRTDTRSDPSVEQLLAELIRFAEHHLEISTYDGNES